MSSIKALYIIFFTTGLTVGFGHCIGMCGPIVVSLSLNVKGRNVFASHVLYNSGRIITYAVLGGIMGATGSFTGVVSNIAGVQKGVLIFAGFLIMLMGFALSGWIPLGRIFGEYYNPGGMVSRAFRKLLNIRATMVYLPLGMLLGFLPCGPVYTALIASARAGMEATIASKGSLIGMGVMLSFGLGTVPALFLVYKLANFGWLKSRKHIYKISAILMVILGIYFMVRGIQY